MRPLILILCGLALWYAACECDGFNHFYGLFGEEGWVMAHVATLCVAGALVLSGLILAIVRLCRRFS